jgi:hypothetical protein
MILDTTVHTPEVKRIMAAKVGEPYSMMERIRMGGVGSKRMRINSVSEQFTTYFSNQLDTVYCNIEIRKAGFVIHFKKYQTVYSWLIPSNRLQIENDQVFTLISEEHRFSLTKDRLFNENKVFLQKLFVVN